MIKFVASDLDGTLLLNGAQKLPEEIFAIIKELKKLGILFVAASGRQYANMKELFEPVVDDMAFICENGALVVQNDKVIYQDKFEEDLIKDIVKTIYEKEGSEFSCSTKDYYYIRPKTQKYSDLMLKIVQTKCKIIQDFDEIVEPCMKAAVYERGGTSDESIAYWQEKFSDKCTVVTSGLDWVDFIPFGTNKAKGIKLFQQMLNVKPEECMAFGDENNDVEMMYSVEHSFAMEHAREKVINAAKYKTEKVENVLWELIKNKGEI